MSKENENAVKIELSEVEKTALQSLASADPPYSQRALALLTLDDGADLSAAGITADLTVNQVRYWLGRFRTGRLAVFPAELLDSVSNEDAMEKEPPMLAVPEAAPMLAAPPIAGELPEAVPGSTETIAAAAAGASAVVVAKKKKKGKKKGKKATDAKKAKKSGKKKKSKKSKSKKSKSKKSKPKKSKPKNKKKKKDKKKK